MGKVWKAQEHIVDKQFPSARCFCKLSVLQSVTPIQSPTKTGSGAWQLLTKPALLLVPPSLICWENLHQCQEFNTSLKAKVILLLTSPWAVEKTILMGGNRHSLLTLERRKQGVFTPQGGSGQRGGQLQVWGQVHWEVLGHWEDTAERAFELRPLLTTCETGQQSSLF